MILRYLQVWFFKENIGNLLYYVLQCQIVEGVMGLGQVLVMCEEVKVYEAFFGQIVYEVGLSYKVNF